MSFPKSFIIKEIGVTTRKNTTPITMGDTIFPNKIPNLNQLLFKGVKIIELIKPNTKKITLMINAHNLISFSFSSG